MLRLYFVNNNLKKFVGTFIHIKKVCENEEREQCYGCV